MERISLGVFRVCVRIWTAWPTFPGHGLAAGQQDWCWVRTAHTWVSVGERRRTQTLDRRFRSCVTLNGSEILAEWPLFYSAPPAVHRNSNELTSREMWRISEHPSRSKSPELFFWMKHATCLACVSLLIICLYICMCACVFIHTCTSFFLNPEIVMEVVFNNWCQWCTSILMCNYGFLRHRYTNDLITDVWRGGACSTARLHACLKLSSVHHVFSFLFIQV